MFLKDSLLILSMSKNPHSSDIKIAFLKYYFRNAKKFAVYEMKKTRGYLLKSTIHSLF